MLIYLIGLYHLLLNALLNETIKVFNALRKYLKTQNGDDTEFSDVVVELAREKNSQEKKDLIKKIQKANEEKTL